MAPLTVALALLLHGFARTTTAQSTESTIQETVWSSFAFIMHGERTPIYGPYDVVLTPAGAQQMYTQGAALRSRYLMQNTAQTAAERNITSREPIFSISRTAIDASQLSLAATEEPFVVSGAQAFMQGLYPPVEQAFGEDAFGDEISLDASTGNITQYPMGGYQYPPIKTLSVSDSESIFLQGQANCPQWVQSSQTTILKDPIWADANSSTYSFYQNFFSDPIFRSMVPMNAAGFYNAYNLYDFALYQYNHNQTIYEYFRYKGVNSTDPSLTRSAMQILENYAENQQYAMNANRSVSGHTKGDMILTIAGRTMAQKVLDMFRLHYTSGGNKNKLNIAFGSLEPFLAFFGLSGLRASVGDIDTNPFWKLPGPGAAMVFELIGTSTDQSTSYLDWDNLRVRFLYRPDAEPGTPFREYSIFGATAVGHRMPWADFEAGMEGVAMDVAQWCSSCGTPTSFCSTGRSSVGNQGSSSPLDPTIAGVIGAIVTLVVVALGLVAAFFFGGFRLRKEDRRSSFGGFKGAEKMASDTDLAVTGAGRHERTGSWELRGGKAPAGASVTPTTTTAFDTRERVVDDDEMWDIGAAPVRPQESV